MPNARYAFGDYDRCNARPRESIVTYACHILRNRYGSKTGTTIVCRYY